MSMMRTANPALNEKTFGQVFGQYGEQAAGNAMTLQGTVNKTAILLLLVVAGAAWTWHLAAQAAQAAPGAAMAAAMPWVIGGLIGGIVLALITIFKPTASPYTSPLYALCEGLVLGAISAMFNQRFPGIVPQAVGLTFGTLAAMLVAYTTRTIRATEKFKLGVVAATGGIALVYFISIILNLFGVHVPYIYSSGPIGIAFSVFVVVIAALNLVLDFDFIETGIQRGAPKYMEWYGAFGILVTLVWLYIEILNLLAKLRD